MYQVSCEEPNTALTPDGSLSPDSTLSLSHQKEAGLREGKSNDSWSPDRMALYAPSTTSWEGEKSQSKEFYELSLVETPSV